MALVVQKYSTTGNGEQSVIITGMKMTPLLSVINLVMHMLLEPLKVTTFLTVPDKYGQIMSVVLGVNKICSVVHIGVGEKKIADTMKTQEQNVLQQVISQFLFISRIKLGTHHYMDDQNTVELSQLNLDNYTGSKVWRVWLFCCLNYKDIFLC